MQNRDLSLLKSSWLTKTNRRFVVWVLALGMVLLHGVASGQCTSNLGVRLYDTVITGPGYGTYHFAFPKWNSDSGLLVSVKISAVVNLQYGFSLKNVDTLAGSYGVWAGREDYFTSPALSAAYDNINEQKIGTYPLSPGAQMTMPSFPFLSNYANVDSITATAPFLGAGSVNFDYSPITYTNIHSSNNASYSYHATVVDQTHFSVSYLYCRSTGVLASSLTSFTAVLRDPVSVQLNWSTTGEEKGRVYEVQRSADGKEFLPIGRKEGEVKGAGASDYSFVDGLMTGAGLSGAPVLAGSFGPSGKLYYRLRIVDAASVTYSSIKTVNIGDGGSSDKLVLYPNPAVDHINLLIPGDGAGDWMINIRTADGRLVQTANFFHSNNLPIFFHQNLAPGVYFIQVTDLQGRNGRVTSFRVNPR